MAGVKTTSYVDEIIKPEAAERRADRDAILAAVQEEHDAFDQAIDDIRDAIDILLKRSEVAESIINQLVDRVRRLEGRAYK